jgi:F-box/TPR repeat protein Pof3
MQLETVTLVTDEDDHLWKELKVIVIHGSANIDPVTAEGIRRLTSIRRGCDLEHIDLDFWWKYGDAFGPVSSHAVSTPELNNNNYENIRSLRLTQNLIAPERLRHFLHDAMSGQKLHTLDIFFPLEQFGTPFGQNSSQHLQSYAWLRGATSIRCLGVSEFRFREYPKNDDDLPLPSFLASFPNLETLEINSSHYEGIEFCTVVEAIVKVTKLKKIYQNTIKGVYMDKLKEVAKKSGVELVWGERPRPWPFVIDE